MAVKWPQGFRSGAASCGIRKSGRFDLAVLVADRPVEWCGTFTRNAAAAPPVHWSRGRLGEPVRGIVVNSGNANACTGPAGFRDVEKVMGEAAAVLDCAADGLLVASTGPIGIPLPVDKIVATLPSVAETTGSDTQGFAEAILTTDTVTKMASATVGDATVVGVAKGSAMLAPNMATMLAFVTTDAVLPDGTQSALEGIVDKTFNSISVDECESTNDSVFVLSSGIHQVDEAELLEALHGVCASLAEQMVRDAEGATKLVRISVTGAGDEGAAHALGKAIAASVLWRSAAHGGDPNWGRILSALGSADRSLDLSEVKVAVGAHTVFSGEPVGSLETAAAEMTGDDVSVHCVVGSGPGSAQILSVDLSPDYVTMNAGGLT